MEKIWQKYYDSQVSPSIDYPEKTVYQLFQDAVKENPKGTATLFFGAGISYSKLDQLVTRFSNVLFGLGVRKGDRVALVLPNIPVYPIAHLAVMRLGGILVPTNPLYVERELAYQLNDSGAETVVIFNKLYPRLEKVKAETKVKRVIVVGLQEFLPKLLGFLYGLKNKSSFSGSDSDHVYQYTDLMKRTFPAVQEAAQSTSETAILLFTGGTTGVSKGAVLTHRNLTVNALQAREWLWQIENGKERLLCVLPFFHSYGMTTGIHLSVVTMSAMILLPRFDIKEAIKRIKKHRPTIFCAVPSMYNAINHFPNISGKDVGSINLCVSGGSGLPEEVQKQFELLTGGKLVEGYGLSETSPIAIANPIVGHRKNGTIGVPISDTEAKVVDPDTRKELSSGSIGELAIKGPQVMKGYWNMEDETTRVLQEGWLFTGDMAVMDGEGFFSIVDRKKDLIISAGMNIYPREVEEVLHQHPKIVEAAVIGAPSKVREETVKAFIVIKEEESLTKAEVIQFCRDKLSKFKIPKEIEFRKELPKSAVGKILKRVLKDEELKKKK